MARGIDGFGSELQRLATQYESLGPGAYHRLTVGLLALHTDDALRQPLTAAWTHREFNAYYARHLLLLASFRFLALDNPDHPLAPEVLADAETGNLDGRLRAALADPELVHVLATRAVQTNEPGRGLGWGLVATILRLKHKHFALADLGCSAGLNLVLDRTPIPFRVGDQPLSCLDFPSPGPRLGLDVSPVDIDDDTEVRWLRACLWPGQTARLARLEACLNVWRSPWEGDSPPPTLSRHDLCHDDTAGVLEALGSATPDGTVLAFESVVRDYLPADAAAAHQEAMRQWLSSGPNRLWIRLDPAPRGPRSPAQPMSLAVEMQGYPPIEIARTPYHPDGCLPVAGALDTLRARWRLR